MHERTAALDSYGVGEIAEGDEAVPFTRVEDDPNSDPVVIRFREGLNGAQHKTGAPRGVVGNDRAMGSVRRPLERTCQSGASTIQAPNAGFPWAASHSLYFSGAVKGRL